MGSIFGQWVMDIDVQGKSNTTFSPAFIFHLNLEGNQKQVLDLTVGYSMLCSTIPPSTLIKETGDGEKQRKGMCSVWSHRTEEPMPLGLSLESEV